MSNFIRKSFPFILSALMLASVPAAAQNNHRRSGGERGRQVTNVSRKENHSARESRPRQKKESFGNRPFTSNRGDRDKDRRPGNGNRYDKDKNKNKHDWGKDRRPGNSNRPNWNGNRRPGGGHSAPRPGAGGSYRPGNDRYWHNHPRPNYGRPKYHFGRWRPLPPPPPRPRNYYVYNYSVPSISSILGITFGTLIDYGIRSLINAGYTVAGYQNNAIFLNNIPMLGLTWPQATVYYGNNGMNGALFQYRSDRYNAGTYDDVYYQLCRTYGDPLESRSNGTSRSATWWGGNNTGYITLSVSGQNNGYYNTDLIYGYE